MIFRKNKQWGLIDQQLFYNPIMHAGFLRANTIMN